MTQDFLAEYIMYSRTSCQWCDKLRELLVGRGVNFTEVKIDHSLENRDELIARYPEAKTVPQLFYGDHRIGGYTDAVSYFEEADDANS